MKSKTYNILAKIFFIILIMISSISLCFIENSSVKMVDAEQTPNYLTLTAKGGTAEITFKYYEGTDVQYSLNGGSWIDCKPKQDETGDVFTLTNGEYVQFKGTKVYTKRITESDPTDKTISIYTPYHFSMVAKTNGATVEASGDVTSLTNGVGGNAELTYHEGEYAFMFYNCAILTKAPNLPSTTLAASCYNQMFYGCSNLVSAPELPAETLTQFCYNSMFSGCTSLESAPELPAETLAANCYSAMFSGCTSLVSASELSATELEPYCYASMFKNCSNLVSAPELSATTLADHCYDSMFYGCSNLVSAPELPAKTLEISCYASMFSNSGILKPVNISHVTSLAANCFEKMYSECEKIGMTTTKQDGYTIEWKVPNVSTEVDWNKNMFYLCGSSNCCDTNKGGSSVEVDTTYYIAKYYNIAYDLNGGSGTTPTDNNIYRVGDKIDFDNGSGLSNGNKTFKGWNSSSSATSFYTSLTIQKENLPETGDTITFYAIWGNAEETYKYDCDSWDKEVGAVYNKGDAIKIIDSFGCGLYLKVRDKNGDLSVIKISMNYTYTIQNDGAYVEELTTDNIGNDYILIIDQYSLTYDLNGGSGTAPTHNSSNGALDVDKNITLASGSGLTKTGYSFAGWSSDKDETTGSTGTYTITANDIKDGIITLYAIWKKDTYTIAYKNIDGATNPNTATTYQIDSDTITLSDPSKTGYTFKGWYDSNDENGNIITEITKGSSGNIDLYAIWEVSSYTITYNLNDGSNNTNNPSSYTVESNDITLLSPSKDGYTFIAWYDNSEFSGAPVTTISKGTSKDTELYARFCEIIEYDGITYNVELKQNDITYLYSTGLPSNTYYVSEETNIYSYGIKVNEGSTVVLYLNNTKLTNFECNNTIDGSLTINGNKEEDSNNILLACRKNYTMFNVTGSLIINNCILQTYNGATVLNLNVSEDNYGSATLNNVYVSGLLDSDETSIEPYFSVNNTNCSLIFNDSEFIANDDTSVYFLLNNGTVNLNDFDLNIRSDLSNFNEFIGITNNGILNVDGLNTDLLIADYVIKNNSTGVCNLYNVVIKQTETVYGAILNYGDITIGKDSYIYGNYKSSLTKTDVNGNTYDGDNIILFNSKAKLATGENKLTNTSILSFSYVLKEDNSDGTNPLTSFIDGLSSKQDGYIYSDLANYKVVYSEGSYSFAAVSEHVCEESGLTYNKLLTPNYIYSGNYYLDEDTKLLDNLLIDNDIEFNLCLNGYVLNLNKYCIYSSLYGGDANPISSITEDISIISCNNDSNHKHYYKINDDGLAEIVDSGSLYVTGGVIYNGSNATRPHKSSMSIYDGPDGGAISLEFTGSSNDYNIVITIKNVNFLGNSSSSNGGAIHLTTNSNVYNCNFIGNKAVNYGGALNFQTTDTNNDMILVKDCIFKYNSANYGGACNFSNYSYVTIINTSIEYNTATVSGGGVYFGESAGEGGCVLEGTDILMGDGTYKKIEDIEDGDLVKSFDHYTGLLTSKEVYYIYENTGFVDYVTLNFENNIVNVAYSHAFLEQSSLKYVVINKDNVSSYVGKYFYNAYTNSFEKLVSYSITNAKVSYYSIETKDTINFIANNMLTSSDDITYLLNVYDLDNDLKYDSLKKENDINEYGLLTYNEYLNLTEETSPATIEYFNNYHLENLFVCLGKGLVSYDELYSTRDIGRSYFGESSSNTPKLTGTPLLGGTTEDEYDTYITKNITDSGIMYIGSKVTIKNNTVNNKANNLALKNCIINLIEGSTNINISLTMEYDSDNSVYYNELLIANNQSDKSLTNFISMDDSNLGFKVTEVSDGDNKYYQYNGVNEYTISFDENSITSNEGTPTDIENVAPTTETDLSSFALTSTGYVFLGWSTSSESTTGLSKYTLTVSDDSDNDGVIILYAIWAKIIETEPSKGNDYTVTIDERLEDDATYQWQKGNKMWTDATSEGLYYCNIGNNASYLNVNSVTAVSNCYFQVNIGGTELLRFKFEGDGTVEGCTYKDGYYYPTYDSENNYYTVQVSNKGDNDKFTDIEVYTIVYANIDGETTSSLSSSTSDAYYRLMISVNDVVEYTDSFKTNKVSFDSNGATGTAPSVVYQLENRTITLPTTTLTKAGYSFLGWNTDKDETEAITSYTMGSTDATLYAIWGDKTSISITETAQEKTYNGSSLPFEIKGTSLDASSFKIEYKVSGSWTETAPTVAGSYNVKITRSEDNTYKAYSIEISNGLVINKVKVTLPTANTNLKYTGSIITGITLPDGALYTLSDSTGTNAGDYTATAKLSDTTNYEWNLETPVSADQSIAWSIAKAQAVITVDTTPIVKTYGEAVTVPTGSTNFGTVSCDKTASDLVNAGTYTITYTVAGSSNYDGATKTVSVTINTAKVSEPTISVNSFTYDGLEHEVTITGAESFMTKSSDSVTKATSKGVYTVTYTLDSNHEWSDGSDGIVTWSIGVGLTSITLSSESNITKVYGEEFSLPTAESNFGDVSCDKNLLDLVNVGTYTVTYSVTGTNDYSSATKSITVTITKAQAVITVDTTPIVKTYGETVTVPTATSNFGTVSCDKTSADLVNAGTYTITYTVDSTSNYDGATKTVSVTISKAKLSVPTLSGEFTYNKNNQTVTINCFEADLMKESDGSVKTATNAGEYKVIIELKDKDNYEWSTEFNGELSWTISKAQAVITLNTTPIVVKEGEALNLPNGTSNFGTVSRNKDVSDMASAGVYTVIYSVLGTNNYFGATKELSVTVKAATLEKTNVEDETIKEVIAETEDGFDPVITLEVKITLEDLISSATTLVDYFNLSFDNIKALSENERVGAIFDVKLINSLTNEVVQPEEGETVTVRMLLPESIDVSKITRVLHVHSESEASEIEFSDDMVDSEGYFTFETDKFSEFAFIYEVDETFPWWGVVLIILGSFIIIFIGLFIIWKIEYDKAVKENDLEDRTLSKLDFIYLPINKLFNKLFIKKTE